jgi:chromosome segregation ATPase
MRRLFAALLAALGLVSARRYETLARSLDSLKASAAEWKKKASEAEAQQRSLQAELTRQSQLVVKLRGSVDKWKEYHVDVKKLRDRLADTERELMVARDHLMAIEVKLDILEGAANVLDRRSRSTAPQDRHETGARA